MNTKHIPVLSHQVLEFLHPSPGCVIIDCTVGAGGHSEAILEASQNLTLYALDADERNLEIAKQRLTPYKNVHFLRNNFENLEEIGENILKKEKRIDGILFDLGLSSLHVDEPERGFSFRKKGPLDMRFDTRATLTASDIIHSYPLKDLISLFYTYGEERFSRHIASEIVRARRSRRFHTTTELADFIEQLYPSKSRDIHPATRVFQALRIATNRELEVLGRGLNAAVNLLSPGGRVVVISYHSLEDRIVKNIFRESKREKILRLLTPKPFRPGLAEIRENRRSRSAKLRAAEKL